MNDLICHIRKYISLTLLQEKLILSKATILSPVKKEILEQSSTIHRHTYFVNQGCLHLYQVNEKGNEQTIQFAIKNWWLTDYDSFNFQTPSRYNIQVLEDSKISVLLKNDLEELLFQIPELERYFRVISQRAYAASLYRISLMYSYSKEERYLNFIQQFPEFVQQVPQYILGSFLGMSAEYISEIRKKQTQNDS